MSRGATRECAEFLLRDDGDSLELTHRGPGWKFVWSRFGSPGSGAPQRPGAQRPCEGFTRGSVVKNLPARWEMQVQSPCWEDPPEKEMATHSSILVWEIPGTEGPAVHGVVNSWT